MQSLKILKTHTTWLFSLAIYFKKLLFKSPLQICGFSYFIYAAHSTKEFTEP